MGEHDEKCLKALRGLVEMARANWPRSQDITVSIASGATAHGAVTIPVYLLDKLLTAQKET